MGKAEGDDKLWHGHVTALTVSPDFRRMGIAKRLMDHLEEVSEKMYALVLSAYWSSSHLRRYDTYFVDLFVRSSNVVAIGMYEHFGYSIYRRVLGYYTGLNPEDALGKTQYSLLAR